MWTTGPVRPASQKGRCNPVHQWKQLCEDGPRCAGTALATLIEVTWAQSLLQGVSAQKAELIALIQALRWVNSQPSTSILVAVCLCHSTYPWCLVPGTRHANPEGREIKTKEEEVLALLAAVWLPEKLAIVHCLGHQRGGSVEEWVNRFTDAMAKGVTTEPMGPLQILGPLSNLTLLPEPHLLECPMYTSKEENWTRQQGSSETVGSSCQKPCGHPFSQIHQNTPEIDQIKN